MSAETPAEPAGQFSRRRVQFRAWRGERPFWAGLFVMLALLAEPAPKLASTLAWGFDAAAFLTLWDNPVSTAVKSKTSSKKAKTS